MSIMVPMSCWSSHLNSLPSSSVPSTTVTILIAGDHFNRRRIVMVLNIDCNRSKSLSLIHYDILLIYHQSSGLTDVSIQLFQQSTGQVDIPPINTISSRILVLRRSTGLDEKMTGYIDNTSCWITISSSW